MRKRDVHAEFGAAGLKGQEMSINAGGQTICLCMIVKDEAPVIRRCLETVRPLIDHWIIVDTGSTDGTQDVVRDSLRDLPGEVVERPWRDFAYNRSEALRLARPHADFSLIIDADDTLEIDPDTRLPELTQDSYYLEIRDRGSTYWRQQLVRNALPWRYEGVLHEFLACDEAESTGSLTGIRMYRGHDGARRRNPETYRRDAEILARALESETDPFLISRYSFYLAQSYSDYGEKAKALDYYLKRAGLGFWREEEYVALHRAAGIMAELGYPPEEVLATYRRAREINPARVEAYHGASSFCRRIGSNEEGYRIAKEALDLTPPSDVLFLEEWVYDYGLADEFSVNAFWAGHYRESLEAALKLLGSPKLPADQRDRIAKNADFALAKLDNPEPLPPVSRPDRTRALRSRLPDPPPLVMLEIEESDSPAFPAWLRAIERLDYPKSRIFLYARLAQDPVALDALRQWLDPLARQFAAIEIAEGALARDLALQRAVEEGCEFLFTADPECFLRENSLQEIVAANLPIVAPMLRSVSDNARYSNFHAAIDSNGYFKEHRTYDLILSRQISGLIEVPVVNRAYLVRKDVAKNLSYTDGTGRYPYVMFSDSARRSGVPQYIDNRDVYGYVVDSRDMATVRLAESLLGRDADRGEAR